MQLSQTFFYVLELIGTVSFALSGGMIAIQKKADFLGVLLLATATSVGGGILRDLFLGKIPPTSFVEINYILTALVTAVILFVFVATNEAKYRAHEGKIAVINNVFDAIGLGIFTVVGVQIAQNTGHGENLAFVLFLGVVTSVGGGIIRDLMLQEMPFVLKKRVYAVAALLGGLCYWCLEQVMSLALASGISIAFVFIVRMLATKFQWNLPKAIK